MWCGAGASPLSPVIKSLITENEPAAGHLRGRNSLMRAIDQRFRFLAVSLMCPQDIRRDEMNMRVGSSAILMR